MKKLVIAFTKVHVNQALVAAYAMVDMDDWVARLKL